MVPLVALEDDNSDVADKGYDVYKSALFVCHSGLAGIFPMLFQKDSRQARMTK